MTEKIKLLLVADTYHPKVDGTLIFMQEFIKRAQNHFDLSLLVPRFKENKEKENTKLTYLETSNLLTVSGYPSLKLSFRNLHKIKEAIKKNDIIFVQGPALISYLSIYYGHRLKKKTVFYTHTLAWELFEKFFPPLINKLFFKLMKQISIKIYNYCDEIFVPYQDLAVNLRKMGIRPNITVAKLGVDIERFSPSTNTAASKKKIGLPADKIIIGYVGRISKEKNTKILLQAFQKLKNQENLFLLLVGDGPAEQKEIFKELKNYRITGFVHNVPDYLRAMDIFVMPSLTETTSLVTLEAMACRIPIIASKVGFIQHYIIKNHNGLFFPKDNSTLLALKIERLIKNEDFRDKLSQNARKTVAYSLSWERSINKIERLLKTIAVQN